MLKQGGVRKNWKERYFVLTMDSLCYYDCKKDVKVLKKNIPVPNIIQATAVQELKNLPSQVRYVCNFTNFNPILFLSRKRRNFLFIWKYLCSSEHFISALEQQRSKNHGLMHSNTQRHSTLETRNQSGSPRKKRNINTEDSRYLARGKRKLKSYIYRNFQIQN